MIELLMDADCLIKLTKSGLKEVVCEQFSVSIPQLVKEEAVDRAPLQADSHVIGQNVQKGYLKVVSTARDADRGEEAVFEAYESGGFAAICSDDKRFISRLRLLNIPYITPAVLVALLVRERVFSPPEALDRLESLSLYVSDEEYAVVKLVLDMWRKQ